MDIITNEGGGGVTEWGYHELEPFLKCPKRYQFERVRGIAKPLSAEPEYFTTGSMVHAGRAKWLASGSKTDSATIAAVMQAIEDVLAKLTRPASPDALPNAKKWVSEYIDHWSLRPAPKCVATELKLEATFHGQPFTARLDDVGFYDEEGGALCLGECKTTSASIKACHNQYMIHPQPMLQRALFAACAEGEGTIGKVDRTILDIIQKGYGKEKSKFARVTLRFSQQMIDSCVKYLAKERARARSLRWESTSDAAERNFTSCNEKTDNGTFACPYRSLCLSGRDASLEYVSEGKFLTSHAAREGVNIWE